MKKNKLLIILSISIVFTFILFTIKDVFAIQTGVDRSGLPSSTFKTNYTGTNVNYIQDAFTAAGITDTSTYYTVPKDLKINGGSTPLYILSRAMSVPGSTEDFEIINGDNPSSITDKGLLYIINHGYNTTNTTNTVFTDGAHGSVTNNTIKQYITQIAVWLYLSEHSSSFNTTYCANDACALPTNVRTLINNAATGNYQYLKYIPLLVDRANSYSGRTTSRLQVLDNVSLGFTVDTTNNLFITNNVTPTSVSNNDNYLYYSVEISDPNNYGIYLTDSSNNRIDSLNNMSGSFKVCVPLPENLDTADLSSVEIRVYGHYMYDEGYDYRVTNSSNGLVDDDNKNQKYSDATLGYSPKEVVASSFGLQNFVKISKINVTNSKELPGATLKITKKGETTPIDEFVSGESPHYLYLDNGDYTLCETIPPEGFALNTECVDFTVDGTSIKTVTMENAPITPTPDTGLNQAKITLIVGLLSMTIGGAIYVYTIGQRKKNEIHP